ncbi:hypothetical protein D6T64_06700 [Cryobacterium melibiosiphilum]|uniref:Uncharacterized protein n=1 Tax=Cryobacterium melibiosiphilum TaxID=995039 RepID=A0A3A5MWB1_9MICO|nr:permease prefix domain 1-containing protein [Cryobacterium melibiosiphilum]RJT89504.1 hypothetical protein D6T64_06700 [Cryobacterium melibiosiphilum]
MAEYPLNLTNAEYPLIRRYLLAVDPVIRHRTDAQDLLDELADHLIEAVERLRASGVDSDSAERRSLSRFGDPDLIASLINSVPAKGHAMHTIFSREASFFAFVAAVLWTAAAVSLPFAQDNLIASWTQGAYVTAIVLISAAIAASGIVLLSLNVQVTGAFDAVAGIVATLLVLALLAAFLFGWFLFGWLGLLIAATAVTMSRARASAVGVGAPTVLLGYVWPTFTLLVLVAAIFVTGPTPLLGSPAIVVFDVVALPLVLLGYAAGNVLLGQRMRALTPHAPAPDDAGRGPFITA